MTKCSGSFHILFVCQILNREPSARKITTSKSKYFKMSLRTKQQPSQNWVERKKAATNWQEKTLKKKHTILEVRRTINLKELFGYQTGVPSTEVYEYTGYTGYSPKKSNIDPTTVTGVPISKKKCVLPPSLPSTTRTNQRCHQGTPQQSLFHGPCGARSPRIARLPPVPRRRPRRPAGAPSIAWLQDQL